jgi:hypothetical protein
MPPFFNAGQQAQSPGRNVNVMIFKRLNRTSPEQVYAVFKNNEGSAFTANQVVQLDMTSSVDGVNIVEPNASELNAVVGILDAALANGAYGLVQIYGYRSQANIELSGSSIAVGNALLPRAGSKLLAYGGNLVPASGLFSGFFAAESQVSTAGAGTINGKVFIRMM